MIIFFKRCRKFAPFGRPELGDERYRDLNEAAGALTKPGVPMGGP